MKRIVIPLVCLVLSSCASRAEYLRELLVRLQIEKDRVGEAIQRYRISGPECQRWLHELDARLAETSQEIAALRSPDNRSGRGVTLSAPVAGGGWTFLAWVGWIMGGGVVGTVLPRVGALLVSRREEIAKSVVPGVLTGTILELVKLVVSWARRALGWAG